MPLINKKNIVLITSRFRLIDRSANVVNYTDNSPATNVTSATVIAKASRCRYAAFGITAALACLISAAAESSLDCPKADDQGQNYRLRVRRHHLQVTHC